MALFDNGEPGFFLLFVCYFNMTLEALAILKAGTKIQYLCTMVRGEDLRQFDALYAEVDGATPVTLESIILGFVL